MSNRAHRVLNFLPRSLRMLGTGIVLAARGRTMPVGNIRVPQPAKLVDLAQYLGRWFELGRYDNSFERGCEAVTAEYSLRPDGLIRVLSTCRAHSTDGPIRTAEGKAKVVEGSGGAKLKVSFFGPFFFANYWVLDHADDYAWSIVGEPSGKYLWIMSRDPTPPAGVQNTLIESVRRLGYDTAMIRMTRQPPGLRPTGE